MTISNNQALFLAFSMGLPGPLDRKLALYHFLLKLPLPPLSKGMMMFILFAWPFLIILFLLIIFFLIRFISKTFVPFVFSKFPHKQEKKIFLELTFPTDTSKSAYATEQLYTLLHTLARQQDFWSSVRHDKNEYSLEIVSTKQEGIRYILVASEKFADIIKRNLLSYLPGIQIKIASDYISNYVAKHDAKSKYLGLEEFKLSGHFALPLETQKTLKEHDPISYLTGNMTKLGLGELISFQVITTPLLSHTHESYLIEMGKLKSRMYKGEPLTPLLQKDMFQKLVSLPGVSWVWLVVKIVWIIVWGLFSFVIEMISSMANDTSRIMSVIASQPQVKPQQILNPYEQELSTVVKGKIDQKLFETSIRLLVITNNKDEANMRLNGLLASFGQLSSTYQSLTTKSGLFSPKVKHQIDLFKLRTLTDSTIFHHNPILSTSELSDLFHFPYTRTTKTEGLVTSNSQELPAPLSQKQNSIQIDTIVGKNSYGGEEIPIGLTLSDRKQHVYLVGKTGMGKSTIIKHMAYQDICAGKGICVIDPHGDLVKELLSVIPENRKTDVVYVNPSDKAFPVGLNILNPGGKFSDPEEKYELITSAVMSIFMKITPERHWGQRMEHILRNATLTALQIPCPTKETPYRSLYTIQKLLTDTRYRNSVTSTLTDPVLKQFWKKEFSLYGSMQQAAAISPLTNKLGEFITSKMSRNILLQEKSTISVSQIMDEGKILLCNLSKGELGEDRSDFFGILIISLIQLAAYQRAQRPEHERRDFFLYIDEFQNFATSSFTDLLSEARKYHVFVTPANQNIAQIEDQKLANVLLGNVGVVICFKNGPDDENILLPILEPEVKKGDIVNLPPHHFFMKVTNAYSESAFSGKTTPFTEEGSQTFMNEIIEQSRKNFASSRLAVEQQLDILFELKEKSDKNESKEENRVVTKSSKSVEKTIRKSGKITEKHRLK